MMWHRDGESCEEVQQRPCKNEEATLPQKMKEVAMPMRENNPNVVSFLLILFTIQNISSPVHNLHCDLTTMVDI